MHIFVLAPKPHFCRLEAKIGGDFIACQAAIPRWYHDHDSGECKTFTYGGCGGNKNNFYTKEECEQACAHEVSAH